MKGILILSLFLLIIFIECINLSPNDLCYLKQGKDLKCPENINYNCGDFVCTKSQYNCHILSLFSKSINYVTFMSKIKDCPEPPVYKWKSNDVCLVRKECVKLTIHRLWSTHQKLVDCNCIGKYKYKCKNSNYCASNIQACNHVIKKNDLIKKCN